MKTTLCKVLVSFLLIGSVLSCSETFEPQVNFGDKTFVNDYSQLVEAIKSQDKSLNEKFDALNKILSENFGSVVLSIDSNTSAIRSQTCQLSSDVQGVITSLLNGFKSIKTVGDNLIYAINENGNIIALHLDANGQLISASLNSGIDELIRAINDKTSSFEERFDAFGSLLATGLARIELKIADGTESIVTSLNQGTDAIGQLSQDILSGFKLLKKQILSVSEAIVYAINDNGDTIALHLDSNGELISSQYVVSAKKIVKALDNQTAVLAEKVDVLNRAIEAGLLGIECKINNLDNELCLKLKNINKSLGSLNGTVLDGFKAVNMTDSGNGEMLVNAINSAAERISLRLDANGEVISIAIAAGSSDIVDAINGLSSTIGDKVAALSEIVLGGFADVTVEMTKVGKKIKVGFDNVDASLQGLNTTAFDGFTALKKQLKTSGNSIVAAMNSNGETVAFEIDKAGKLISARVLQSSKEIASTLNNQSATLADKLASIEDALQAGLLSVEVKLGNVGDAIATRLKKIDASLGDIDGSILNGLRAVSVAIDDNGYKLVEAVNESGDIVSLYLDNLGNLIDISLSDAVSDIVAAINGGFSSLADKISALNRIVKSSLADVILKIGGSGDALVAEFKNLDSSLKGLNTSLLNGFDLLGCRLACSGNSIVSAIDRNGNVIALEVDEAGKLLSAELHGSARDIVAAINDAGASLEEKLISLTNAVQNGLFGVNTSLGDVGDYIFMAYTGINSSLGKLDNSILYGFSLIDKAVDRNGNTVATAINDNGDKIVLQIDKSGKLISSYVMNAAEKLVSALADMKNSLSARFEALDEIAGDLAEISVRIDKLSRKLTLSLGDISDGLDAMKAMLADALSNLQDELTVIGTEIGANGDAIVEAIGSNGDTIAFHIDTLGNLLDVTIRSTVADLIAVLSDGFASLDDKLGALGEIISKGLVDVLVKIGEKDDAIIAEFKNLSDALKGISLDLLDGFKLVADAVDENGNTVATAINDNGDKIVLQIDNSGKLVSSSVMNGAQAIVEALSNLDNSLDERLKALDDIVDGIADISISIDEAASGIKINLGRVADEVGMLKNLLSDALASLQYELTLLGTKLGSNGDNIVKALNANGEIIRLQIDTTGKLISAQIDGSAKDIVDALKSGSDDAKAIADKIDALNTIIADGLGEIKLSIDTQTGDIIASLESNTTAIVDGLGDLADNILDGFGTLNAKLDDLIEALGKIKLSVDANTEAILTLDSDMKDALAALKTEVETQGGKVVLAINGLGSTLALQLGPDGEIVKAINLGTAELQDIEAAILANGQSLKDLLAAGNDTAENILKALGVTNEQLPEILEAIRDNKVDLSKIEYTLAELLAISDGIYLDSKDYNEDEKAYEYIYITSTVREAAESSPEVDEGLLSLLVGRSMPEPSKVQYCNDTAGDYTPGSNWHSHCFWKKIEESEPFLKYCDVDTDKDGKTLLKMEKYYSESIWIVKIHDVCSYAHIYGILVNDARNPDKFVQYYKDEKASTKAANEPTWNKGYIDEQGGKIYMGPIKVKFISYDKASGVFCDHPEARIFCQMTEGADGNHSSKSISTKNKNGSPYPDGTQSNITDDGWWTTPDKYGRLTSTSDEPYATFDK